MVPLNSEPDRTDRGFLLDLPVPFLRHAGLPLCFGLWLMLWASLNAWPGQILDPHGLLDLIHGFRSLLFFLAAYLAGLMILVRRSLPRTLFRGPLGLMALYGLVGMIASLLSPEPLVAFYWGAGYVSVFMVLGALLGDSNLSARIHQLVNFNWLIVAAHAVLLLVVSLEVLFAGGLPLGAQEGQMPGYRAFLAMPEIAGMPTVLAGGVARFAAVLGIVSLSRLWVGPGFRRLLWAFLLVFSLTVIFLYHHRGAIMGFVAGSFLVLLLRLGTRAKVVIPAVAVFLLTVVWSFGLQESVGEYLARGQSPEDIYLLTGRVTTWGEGWALFQESPLLGFGFHADRLLLAGQHMHNSWLHALVQTGLLGTLPFVAAFGAAWVLLVRGLRRLAGMPLMQKSLLIETAGVLAFLTARSIPESTGAFYGVDWLLLAPLFAHVQILDRDQSGLRLRTISGSGGWQAQ